MRVFIMYQIYFLTELFNTCETLRFQIFNNTALGNSIKLKIKLNDDEKQSSNIW